MKHEDYEIIAIYSTLAVFLIGVILYPYRVHLKYWWLRNFTETITLQMGPDFKPKIGHVYIAGSPKMKETKLLYLGQNKFKRLD